MMRRVPVDAARPAREPLDDAALIVRGGGVVAIPTDTLYGLAADPFSHDAVARLFAIKGRAAERAIPLIASTTEQVEACVGPLHLLAARLAVRFWPGPLTLLLPVPLTLAPEVSGGTGSVGIRVPAHAVARGLCDVCGHPLTATSANVSGAPATTDPGDVERTLGDRLDLLLDAGFTPGGMPSTIVDVSGGVLRLVRAGAIPWSEVETCAHLD